MRNNSSIWLIQRKAIPYNGFFLRLTSEFLNQQHHILPKGKVEEPIKILEAVDDSKNVEAVICDSGGHHLKAFLDRIVLWGACIDN